MVKRQSVSVIIPCYRDSATLGRAIESVLAQTHVVDEIIVVNDCSPEVAAIESVLTCYPQVVYVKNPVNVGLAATRNGGVAAARGDIVSFLDADDELHPQKIEFQLAALKANSAVACMVERVRPDQDIRSAKIYPQIPPPIIFSNSRQNIYRNRLTGASILISRELLLSVGGYDETLRSCEDFDLWLRLLDVGVLALNVPLPLYLYHYNLSSLSNNAQNISHWELQVLRKYFQRQSRWPLARNVDARVFAFWLLKQMLRYEACQDVILRERIIENIELLSEFRLLHLLLTIIDKYRLYRFYRVIEKLVNRSI